jgi:hypothetical protein
LISKTVPSRTSNLKKDKDFTRDDSVEKMGEDSMQAPEYHQRVGDVKPPVHLKKQQAENGFGGPLKGFDDRTCVPSSWGGWPNMLHIGDSHATLLEIPHVARAKSWTVEHKLKILLTVLDCP